MIIHGIFIVFPAIVKLHIYLFSSNKWQDFFIDLVIPTDLLMND